jgi:hypothetical protein
MIMYDLMKRVAKWYFDTAGSLEWRD